MTTVKKKSIQYLGHLVRKRGRLQWDVQRLRKLQIELGRELALRESQLRACDTLVREFDKTLNPDEIKRLPYTQMRYGRHGELRKAIVAIIRAAAPDAISSNEIFWALQVRFDLHFTTSKERQRWRKKERDFANPLIFVDEVDKAAGGDHDPTMGLFALLEPGTASTFADLSYPWSILDASRVFWVCTSNDADVLPAPILDRLRRFDIAPPTPQQARRIVLRIFDEMVTELPSAGGLRLSQKAIDALINLSPRRIRQAMLEAAGRVIYEGRVRVLERGICPSGPAAVGTEPRRIGFLPYDE